MSVLASETQSKVAACRAALFAVDKHLEPLLARSPPDVTRQLAPLENAELQVGLAYTVASLYFCHLHTQGIDPSDHPIKQELDRIQLYFKKVRSTAEEVCNRKALKERARIDVEAAKRIVQHHTNAAEAVAQRRSEAAEDVKPGLAPAATTPRKKRRLQQQQEQQASAGAAPTGTKAQPVDLTSADADSEEPAAVAVGANALAGAAPAEPPPTGSAVAEPKSDIRSEAPEGAPLPSPSARKKLRRAAPAPPRAGGEHGSRSEASQAGAGGPAPAAEASAGPTGDTAPGAAPEKKAGGRPNAPAASPAGGAVPAAPPKTDAELMPPPRPRKTARKRRSAKGGPAASAKAAPGAETDADWESGPDGCTIS